LRKFIAFLLVILFLLILSNQITIFNILSSDNSEEQVTISKVVDGDTLKLADNRNVRLVNINAPEKNIPASSLATEFMKQFENTSVSIDTLGVDKYGRVLARVYTPTYLNSQLVEQGLASKFLVQQGEEKYFAEKEITAIEQQRGMWLHSDAWGCFTIDVSPKDEIVIVHNLCNLSMSGFSLKDESRKIYKFHAITSQKLTLHTFNGSDNTTDIFWNSKEDVWNNNRDTAYIFDIKGNIAGHYSYGYL